MVDRAFRGEGQMRLSRFTTLLLAATALTVPAIAQELPTGSSVVSGTVGITTAPGAMTVNQGSDAAIINWNTFSIGNGGLVTVNQSGPNAALLNRVTGDAPSTIAGTLTAPGQVFIVNPNGIAITSSGVVDVGAFTASTLGISDSDFLAGTYRFEGDGSSATVSNAGQIAVSTGGYAALLGGRVDNSGSIVAPLGKVGLGAAELITLDFTGDGFLQVAVPSNLDGDDPLISNSGSISADGGYVQMSVAAAKNAARNVINLSGTVEARSFSGRSGAIVLSGDGGQVAVSSSLNTSTTKSAPPPRPAVTIVPIPASRPSFRGGDITITGNAIVLAAADLDASGDEGGGDIRIGGDFHGNGLIPTATTLDVDFLTSIRADALIDGGGGTVVLWSDDTTRFSGNISARGGEEGGDGGFVEVSGKYLAYSGRTDLRAPAGAWGTLLLDPANVVITDNEGMDPADAGYVLITATQVMEALSLGNFEVSTSNFGGDDEGNIRVRSTPIVWNSSPTTLSLFADNNIEFLDGGYIGSETGSLYLSAQGEIVSAPFDGYDIDIGGDFTAEAGTDFRFARNIEAGSVDITSGGYTYVGLVDSTGSVTIDSGEFVDVAFRISAEGEILITAVDDITIYADQPGINTSGDVTLISTGGSLFLGGQVVEGMSSITLEAAVDANIAGSIQTFGDLRVVAGGDVDLTLPPCEVNCNVTTSTGSLFGDEIYVEAGGTLFIRSGATISTYSEGGGPIVINVDTFQNENGVDAFPWPFNGVYVYSDDWDRNELDGLTSDYNLYNTNYEDTPPDLLPTPDVDVFFFIYQRQPTLTLTIQNGLTRQYYGPFLGNPSYEFGDTVNGDDLSHAVNLPDGPLEFVDTSPANAGVGTYAGALRPDPLLVSDTGYLIQYIGGDIDITPAPLVITANDLGKTYGDIYTFAGTEFSASGLLGDDAVASVTLSSAGAPQTAGVSATPYAIVASAAQGTGLANYTIQYFDGEFTVLPRSVYLQADFVKTYGDTLVIDGTEFEVVDGSFVNGDGITFLPMSSPGQAASAGVDFYEVTFLSDIEGTGLQNYNINTDGSFQVVPRPLTIRADDITKFFGTEYVFTGNEYTQSGLVNGDQLLSIFLSSLGQPTIAVPGTYAINGTNAAGTGLENYAITFIPGTMLVTVPGGGPVPQPQFTAPPGFTPAIITLIDPPTADVIPAALGPEITTSEAQATLTVVEQASQQFTDAIAECERQLQTGGDEGAYLSCAGDALDAYADALGSQFLDLPPELQATVQVIRQTAQRVRAAATNPDRRAAVAEARQAVGQMVDFVRQQTELVRAVDPDAQALLQQAGQVMTQALSQLELQLVSAVEI